MNRPPARRRVLPTYPRRKTLRRHRVLVFVWVALAVVELVFLATVTGSIVPALTAPGTDPTTARLAEWARDHGMSPLVTWAEQRTYHAPTAGGPPEANSPLRQLPPPTTSTGPSPIPRTQPAPTATAAAGPTLPVPLNPPAQPPLPGEGHWQVTATVHSKPAMAQTFLRPDATHTSYTVAATWFDPKLISAQLHPGTSQPGGTGWPEPPSLPPSQRIGLLAAFNSGFKLADARGGYYDNGRYSQPLVPGAASMVFFTDGTMTVGQWNRDVTMSPHVAAVRQNLVLLVDHAHLVPGIDTNTNKAWGSTIGNDKYVWRSGIGVTPTGAIVEIVGPSLSAATLADLLQRAGCEQAMELDINPEWTSLIRYQPTADPTNPTPLNVLPTMKQPPDRYNTTSTRDFVALHAR